LCAFLVHPFCSATLWKLLTVELRTLRGGRVQKERFLMHLKNQHSKEMEEKEKEDTGAACSHPDAALSLFCCRAEGRGLS
jgi:hypothetical protein